MAGINKIGYSTHILGTVESVKSCLRIVLYDKYKISDGNNRYKRISLYNIDEVYNLVKQGEYLELRRDNRTEPFQYKHVNEKINGFNVIIYLNSEGFPIGYTEFTNTQGEKRDTNIEINITAKVEDFSITLNDNLDKVEYAEKSYLGTGLENYTGSKTAREKIKNSEQRKKYYTKFVSQAEHTRDSMFLDSGAVVETSNSGLSFMKLGLERNLNYSPLGYNFTNFGTSYYGDDIALCAWNGIDYCISSLTQRNMFGDLITYTKSGRGYFTLPSDEIKIEYSAGKYLVCSSSLGGINRVRAFNTETRDWEKSNNLNVFIDPWDKTGKLYDIPSAIPVSDIYRYLPELVNIYYDYKENEYLRVIRKVGPWFVLDVKVSGESLVLVTGISFMLYLTKEQLRNLIYFDDNTLILNNKSSYQIYRGIREVRYTPEAANLIQSGGSTKCETVLKTSELYQTPFNALRRGAYPEKPGIPEIVSGFKGHLFYIDDSNYIINFL